MGKASTPSTHIFGLMKSCRRPSRSGKHVAFHRYALLAAPLVLLLAAYVVYSRGSNGWAYVESHFWASTGSKQKTKPNSITARAGLGSRPHGQQTQLQARNSSSSSSSRSPPPIPGMQTPEDCPEWLADYAAFHRKQRGQPRAKYLVYSACPGRSGLGDRIRGMLYLVRQAVATKRVILFTWRGSPHDLERYLPPAGPIDWMLRDIQGYDYPDTNTFCERTTQLTGEDLIALKNSSLALRITSYKDNDAPLRAFINKGGLKRLQQQFITIHSNEGLDTACEGCPPVTAAMLTDPRVGSKNSLPQQPVVGSAPCLFRYLFTLSEDVQALVHQQLVGLYGKQARRPDFQFAAMHLRIGGMENEKSFKQQKTGQNGALMDLVQGLTCTSKLGQGVGLDTTKVPILLFTDHHKLRDFVRNENLAGVVTTDVTPTHLARMGEDEANDTEAAISTYVDVALLARAQCAIYSQSGFSSTAWMMGGGTQCYSNFRWGLRGCEEDQET